jgi:hypothetical protein
LDLCEPFGNKKQPFTNKVNDREAHENNLDVFNNKNLLSESGDTVVHERSPSPTFMTIA